MVHFPTFPCYRCFTPFFLRIEHIPRVCGPTHARSTCMNFFYRTADKQSFMMMVRLGAISLFLENRGEERNTSKRASVTLSVTRELRSSQGFRGKERLLAV